jgi:hypothetical protein
MERYSDVQIAAEVHEAIKGLQMVQADRVASAVWDVSHPQLRLVNLRGVERARRGATPREHHQGWVDDMASLGWVYGPVRDPEAKTHPNMVTWERLPWPERHKDELGLLIITWMAGLEWPS